MSESIIACATILRMKPKEQFTNSFISKAVWNIYRCSNFSHKNLASLLLNGTLTRMCEPKHFARMLVMWENFIKTLPGTFPVHSQTLHLVETLMTQ